MHHSARFIALPAVVFLLAFPLSSQSTGTPVYAAPYRAFSSSELGISFSDPGPGFALEGSYRAKMSSSADGGFRIGVTSGGGHGSNSGILLGGDARWRAIDHSEGFPLDGAFTLGLGIHSVNGFTAGYLPVGLTLGRRILVEGSKVSFVPYVHPVLTPTFGDASGTAFTIGFGADIRLNPRLDLRFSAGLGDRDGIAFTAAFLR